MSKHNREMYEITVNIPALKIVGANWYGVGRDYRNALDRLTVKFPCAVQVVSWKSLGSDYDYNSDNGEPTFKESNETAGEFYSRVAESAVNAVMATARRLDDIVDIDRFRERVGVGKRWDYENTGKETNGGRW